LSSENKSNDEIRVEKENAEEKENDGTAVNVGPV
jgi:hypothetical protein